ncbi:MAG: hypothetical protein K0R98_1057 [Rickettsiaceae bacterium]|jgi:hypothetical protein|nr:hypothetical protein [Rickettsiaceae bacterium]
MRADYFETLPSIIKMPFPKNSNVTDVTNVTTKESLINTNMLTVGNLLHLTKSRNVTGVTTPEVFKEIKTSVTPVTSEHRGDVTNRGETKIEESNKLSRLLHRYTCYTLKNWESKNILSICKGSTNSFV